MRISELTFEKCLYGGKSDHLSMPYDEGDYVRICRNADTFDRTRDELQGRFGDVEVAVRHYVTSTEIEVLDADFIEAHKAYIERKAECMRKDPYCD